MCKCLSSMYGHLVQVCVLIRLRQQRLPLSLVRLFGWAASAEKELQAVMQAQTSYDVSA
jgi:hypothetical protein